MSNQADFLVEIQTEELPPKALLSLATSFHDEIKQSLASAQLTFSDSQFFATPRRLAVIVNDLLAKQPDNNVLRRGPAWQAAFNSDGKPLPACEGFARSCNTTTDQLTMIENEQGKWVGFQQNIPGKTVQELLPEIIQQALNRLPIPKRMRWGSGDAEFVRPIHSVILLYGKNIIAATILGINSERTTHGHRFYATKELTISEPSQYADILYKKGHVMADFTARKNQIRNSAEQLVAETFKQSALIAMDESLLNEVTGLVEWPVALLGKFDAEFLTVPQEALISAMQDHQRYFPIVDANNKLLPYFVTISNIDSTNPQQIIDGNERVLRARLSDAAFFYTTDKKTKLIDRLDKLKGMIFQAKLGSLQDKARRLAKLTGLIGSELQLNKQLSERAGLLAKTDLTTALVNEFPELQGIAGYYYALNDQEDPAIAAALQEQYCPRFSGDKLPESTLGCALALADRLDTLVGIFGIHLLPTGEKDPFGLRRAALGILRILIEKELNLDLLSLLKLALSCYEKPLPNENTIAEINHFMLERLKFWYQEQGVSNDIFAAVAALNITQPFDMHNRIQAVQAFKKLPEAASLSVANKRVSNILAQHENTFSQEMIAANLFEHDAEHKLAATLDQYANKINSLTKAADYRQALTEAAHLREPVDYFFENVLVMAEDPQKRENRLLMLKKLRALFLQVADIALLQ